MYLHITRVNVKMSLSDMFAQHTNRKLQKFIIYCVCHYYDLNTQAFRQTFLNRFKSWGRLQQLYVCTDTSPQWCVEYEIWVPINTKVLIDLLIKVEFMDLLSISITGKEGRWGCALDRWQCRHTAIYM